MKEQLSLRTVRKKVVMISKAAGIILIISYVASTRLPINQDISYLIWIVLIILLELAVDFLIGYFISKPISALCRSARKIADLDFSSPCEISSNDEFGDLAENLNKMSENLQSALEKLENANIQLEKDIRQERQLLDERKELVDSLSHEMKTPLGIIRAYAEGLQDESDETKKQKYSEVIISETERMSEMINNLLDLSALETGAKQLNAEQFDFVEFLETVAGRLLIDVPETAFEFQYELPDSKIYVCTDKQRMEQVLNNLIVNAVKNVVPNGILKVSLTLHDDTLRFAVFNQGNQIPQEKLNKIWDKFYRDKNAGYGGSGLGLAIVAQILSMQNLEFGANNFSDGVEFFFLIPTIK